MKAVVALMLVAAACRPIDGGVVTRSATPSSVAPIESARPTSGASTQASPRLEVQEFAVGRGQGPHDVAPAADGGVWYTAQRTGELGHLDPKTGAVRSVKLGPGSAPHGVVVGPDGAPWVTDGGLNAIVRVDPKTSEVTTFPLAGPRVDMHTPVFDRDGTLWFTGQGGIYGRLDAATRTLKTYPAPGGAGPYGIASCADGNLYYASLAASYVARVTRETGSATVLTLPTPGQGARRVWCDSRSRVWTSEWNAGQLARFDGASWREWKLPGAAPMAYAVYVDERDVVWLSDFGANALVRFDPASEAFTALPFKDANAAVRQLAGRPGEVWGAMSGLDRLVVVRTR